MIVRLSRSLFSGNTSRRGGAIAAMAIDAIELADEASISGWIPPVVLRLDPTSDETDAESPFHQWAKGQGELGVKIAEFVADGAVREVLLPAPPPTPASGDWYHRPQAWRRAPPLDVLVEDRAESDWEGLRLSLEDAKQLAREPINVYAENSRHDTKFVHWLADST